MERKDQPSTCVPRGENMIYKKKECGGKERGVVEKGKAGEREHLILPEAFSGLQSVVNFRWDNTALSPRLRGNISRSI
jgi:hypothetical protein